MNRPRVQFLTFPGCPNAGAARRVLEEAMRAVGLNTPIEDVDVHDPATPADLQNWASPTILVNGKDVAGGEVQQGTGCRIYAGEDNAPDLNSIIRALKTAMVSADE